jgi:hypothetical protein
MQENDLRESISSPIRKRNKLGHVILALCPIYLIAYSPNIKFSNIIYILQNEVLYALNKMRL